jgi:hypothetical protein
MMRAGPKDELIASASFRAAATEVIDGVRRLERLAGERRRARAYARDAPLWADLWDAQARLRWLLSAAPPTRPNVPADLVDLGAEAGPDQGAE